MDHHIIFHLYYYFLGGKIGGIGLEGHYSGRFQFGKLGSRTFQSHFEELNDIFFNNI
jgi:hypothetical protein